MDICRQCVYCSKTYSYIGTLITHHCINQKERIEYVSAEELPDVGFAIKQDSIEPPFVHQQQCNTFFHPVNDDSSDTEADSGIAFIDPEQPSVRTGFYGTPHCDNGLASKPSSNMYFDICDLKFNLWPKFSCLEEYRLVHCFCHAQLEQSCYQ
jgi:hypothetical protein